MDAITKFLKCNGFWTDFGLEVSNMDARPREDVGECRVLLPRALPNHEWGDRRRPAGPPAQTPEASSRHKTSKLPGTRLSSLRVMRPSQCRSAWARRLWVRGEKDDVLSAGLCLGPRRTARSGIGTSPQKSMVECISATNWSERSACPNARTLQEFVSHLASAAARTSSCTCWLAPASRVQWKPPCTRRRLRRAGCLQQEALWQTQAAST